MMEQDPDGAIMGIARLASFAREPSPDVQRTVRAVLALVTEALGVSTAYVARFTEDTLCIERAHDPGGLGVHDGDALPLDETFCRYLRDGTRAELVVPDAAANPRYGDLPIVRSLGSVAYSGVALRRADTSIYGTLCTTHPAARVISPHETALLALAGGVVMQMIEAREGLERLHMMIEIAPIGASIIDEHGYVENVNATLCALTEYPRDELIGRHISIFYPLDMREAITAAYDARVRTAEAGTREEVFWTKTGAPITVRVDAMQLTAPDGKPRRASFITDLTAQTRREAALRHDAFYDHLTGLANRTLLDLHLATLSPIHGDADRPAPAPALSALLFVDVDSFKAVNDTHGHAAGDRVLRAVAGRLANMVREGDLVARWGGDEFAILLLDLPDAHTAMRRAQRMLQALSVPITIEGANGTTAVRVSASIGVTPFVAADHADACFDIRTVIAAADAAMYRAKHEGKGRVYLSPLPDGSASAPRSTAGFPSPVPAPA